jgi:hypothetical protein
VCSWEIWRRPSSGVESSSGGSDATTNVAVSLAHSLHGCMAFAAGDPQHAIDRFDAVQLEVTVEQIAVSPILSRVLDR